jgi:hypothetical protein
VLVAVLPHRKHGCCHKKCLRRTFKMNFEIAHSMSVARGLPEKTIAKNFELLITYPHSDRKHLEKRPFTKAA